MVVHSPIESQPCINMHIHGVGSETHARINTLGGACGYVGISLRRGRS
jgi:hypothetical protein